MLVEIYYSYSQVVAVQELLFEMKSLPFNAYSVEHKITISLSNHLFKVFDKKVRALEIKPNILIGNKEYKIKLCYHEVIGLLNICMEGFSLVKTERAKNNLQMVINKLDENK
ncbi:hypothetical protein [Tenacibaculum finnmarkense]|uniref:hypothetical protein n=1 Tax=Tenacibaculum finnmarkense TaxID=2781243 RepID=UPI00187B8DA4|nr:hypothetical protein [Tenacibaculum finnmarkense]MBE7649250.1 hypothetical protein [Tenacibaculum finnmarkense genomovar ulcerans]